MGQALRLTLCAQNHSPTFSIGSDQFFKTFDVRLCACVLASLVFAQKMSLILDHCL